MEWAHGVRVARLRMMFVLRDALDPVEPPPFVHVGAARSQDLDEVVAVDCAAFGSDPATVGPWISELVCAPDDAVTFACARRDGVIVGVGYGVHANGANGRSVGVGGIGVGQAARGRGIGAALATWLVRRGFAAGAELAQLAADDERAVRLYTRLGFVETGSLDVYVEEARGGGSSRMGADGR
jgi:ribosomal protein S18 acetylase RimI-like enzyme